MFNTRLLATAVTIVIASWWTGRRDDGRQPPKCHSNGYIGWRVVAFLTFPIWRPSAILNWNFVILDHPRSRLCCSVVVWKFGVDPIFAGGHVTTLPVWLENATSTHPFWVFKGFNPLKLWVVINTPKGTSLGEDVSFKPSAKSVQGLKLGVIGHNWLDGGHKWMSRGNNWLDRGHIWLDRGHKWPSRGHNWLHRGHVWLDDWVEGIID